MKTNPFFSIIIPTYNRVKFLKIAIDSVLSQSFGDYELLIIDDGSSDRTAKMVAEIKDERIRYIYQPHQGVTPARNKGTKAMADITKVGASQVGLLIFGAAVRKATSISKSATNQTAISCIGFLIL